MNIVAVIPARGGSRRLPGKNLMKLGDKTLVQWADAVAIECGLDTILTTDSEEIMASLPMRSDLHRMRRPANLATDDALTADVVRHALLTYPLKYDAFVLLQPTSPLRAVQDVENVLSVLFVDGVNTAISATEGSAEPNGAVYAARTAWFLEHRVFVDENTIRVPMPLERSIDIDTIADFEKAEDYLLGPRICYADGHVGRTLAAA